MPLKKCEASYHIDEKRKEKIYNSLKKTFDVFDNCEPYKGWILPDGKVIATGSHQNMLIGIPEILDEFNPNWRSELSEPNSKSLPINYLHAAYNIGKSGLNMIRMMNQGSLILDINKDTEITTHQLRTIRQCIKESESVDQQWSKDYYVSIDYPLRKSRSQYGKGTIGYENWHPTDVFDEDLTKESSIFVTSEERPANKITSFLMQQSEKGC